MSGPMGRLNALLLSLACISLAALFLLGLAEILLRPLGHSLSFALEYAGYLTAFCFLLPLGPALAANRHIRLTLTPLARGPVPGLINLAVAVFAATALIRWTMGSALQQARSFFPSQTLLALPQAVLCLGLLGLALAALVLAWKPLWKR